MQKLERLQDKSLRELVLVAERVFHNRETEEGKKKKTGNRESRKLEN